jgi:hypothetical protein
MRPAIINGRSPAFSRRTIPVIERLEARTLLSVATHPAAAPAAAPASTRFAVSDIFGAAAGVPIWQSGQPVLPGTSGSANTAAIFPSSGVSTQTGTGNGTLLGIASVQGGPSPFSLLPILPPDGLAAVVLGMIDASDGTAAAIFNGGSGATGVAGSRARNFV